MKIENIDMIENEYLRGNQYYKEGNEQNLM